MTRKYFLNSIIILTAFTLSSFSEKKAEEKKANIIFILADDLGYGELGCYGQKMIKTPNLDQMATQGMRFTNHYATPVCAPSRGVLITGKHTGHSFIRGNKQAEPYGQLPLPKEIITVPELLKTAGYTTALIGKWGLGVENTSGDPQAQGFDHFFGYYCQVDAHNAFPEFLMRNGKRVNLNNKAVYVDKSHWSKGRGSYSTEKKEFANELFIKDALSFIESNKKNPFFLYLAFTIPHDNGEAPEGERFESPTLKPYENENWTKSEKAYAARITLMDGYVGKLNQKLKSLNLDKNTLVIFTSDNGPQSEDIFNGNGDYRGIKRDLTEGGFKVPLIACWPGKIKAGTVSDHISAFQDFLPTACDVAKIQSPDWTDGISYLPTLLEKKQASHKALYWETHDTQKAQAVRMGKWKGFRIITDTTSDTPITLYDLSSDPEEKNNLADKEPQIVEEVKSIMKTEHIPSEHFFYAFEKKN